MTVIFDMVKGSIESEPRQKAPATGYSETLAVSDLPATMAEVRGNDAYNVPAGHGIQHIHCLLRKG